MNAPSPVLGQPAPDFSLKNQNGETVTLSSLCADKTVLIVFYPAAFSNTCTGELCAIRDDIGAFQTDEVQVIGISCDTKYALRAWADAEGYTFPLLADFWPHGEVAQKYGVFQPAFGTATRGTFLVDRQGILRWSVINGPGQARDLHAYREALAAI